MFAHSHLNDKVQLHITLYSADTQCTKRRGQRERKESGAIWISMRRLSHELWRETAYTKPIKPRNSGAARLLRQTSGRRAASCEQTCRTSVGRRDHKALTAFTSSPSRPDRRLSHLAGELYECAMLHGKLKYMCNLFTNAIHWPSIIIQHFHPHA